MTESAVLDIGANALRIAMMVALPLLLVSLVTGLVISLFQVATSLQDVTLTFVPKILAVGATLLFAGHWILGVLVDYTRHLLEGVARIAG